MCADTVETAWESRIREMRHQLGPLGAYRRLMEENDGLFRGADFEGGGRAARERTALHTVLVQDWAEEQQASFGYGQPFAVAAVGGTGREEMTPGSDLDLVFLFDDVVEGNPFLAHLQEQTWHGTAFLDGHGFTFKPFPFNLDDMPALEGKQLNAFLDLRPVYDPAGLAGHFRSRIRATFDPFEQFLHVRGFWKGRWEEAAKRCEAIDGFDLKNDGLRVFLAGIWTLASKQFLHSHEVYATLEDPRDLAAYHFLLRTRAFIHLRKGGPSGRLPGLERGDDVLTFDDYIALGEMLGPDVAEGDRFELANEARARLLAARRRVGRFARGVIERELKEGRPVAAGSPIVYGTGGLFHRGSGLAQRPEEKSSAALGLLLASQHYGVLIDPSELLTTFHNAGDWLVPVPELAALFLEDRGSLADSFQFLAQIEGAEDRLFPGYARFAASLDERVLTERKFVRSVFEREKVAALEALVRAGRERAEHAAKGTAAEEVEVEAARLDDVHLAGIKLALKTKRLPLTEDDLAARRDERRPWQERFSSGFSEIPLDGYFEPLAKGGFGAETLELAKFLIAHRRLLKVRALDPNDAEQVRELVDLCGSEARVRALYVFTQADRQHWESRASDPGRWWAIDELCGKAMDCFRPTADPAKALTAAGFTREQAQIIEDLGADFHGGRYRRHANRFGEHLVRLVEDPGAAPLVRVFQDGASTILGVAARDYRGLAATITGALWEAGLSLRQAHLFSAMNYGLVLDFFHLAGNRPLPGGLTRVVAGAIGQRRFIADADEALLPAVQGVHHLREWRPGQYCLRFETEQDSGGLVYAVAYRVFRYLRGSIFSLNAHGTKGTAYVAAYFSPPEGLTMPEAQRLVAEHFRG